MKFVNASEKYLVVKEEPGDGLFIIIFEKTSRTPATLICHGQFLAMCIGEPNVYMLIGQTSYKSKRKSLIHVDFLHQKTLDSLCP